MSTIRTGRPEFNHQGLQLILMNGLVLVELATAFPFKLYSVFRMDTMDLDCRTDEVVEMRSGDLIWLLNKWLDLYAFRAGLQHTKSRVFAAHYSCPLHCKRSII